MVVQVVEQEVLVEVVVIVLVALKRQLNLHNQVTLAHTDLETQVVVQVVEKDHHLTVAAEAAVALVLQVEMVLQETMVLVTQALKVVTVELILSLMVLLQFTTLVVAVEKAEEIHLVIAQEDKVVELLVEKIKTQLLEMLTKVVEVVEFLNLVQVVQVEKV